MAKCCEYGNRGNDAVGDGREMPHAAAVEMCPHAHDGTGKLPLAFSEENGVECWFRRGNSFEEHHALFVQDHVFASLGS